MQAYLRRQQHIADEHRQPWQERLAPGDHAVLRDDDLLVYSRILPTPADTWPAPVGSVRFTQGFSSWAPTGEYGFLDVGAFAGPLTGEQFARAEAAGWPSDEAGFRAVVAGDPRWRRKGG